MVVLWMVARMISPQHGLVDRDRASCAGARARPLAESRTAHAATRVHLRVCPPDLDFLQQRHEPRPFRLLSAPSGVSPRASVFRVSLFPATLCFAVFRVAEFVRGCEGPCFVFRVSDFPRLFRACGALGLRRRLRRALTSQGRKPQRQTQTVMKSVRRLYLT